MQISVWYCLASTTAATTSAFAACQSLIASFKTVQFFIASTCYPGKCLQRCFNSDLEDLLLHLRWFKFLSKFFFTPRITTRILSFEICRQCLRVKSWQPTTWAEKAIELNTKINKSKHKLRNLTCANYDIYVATCMICRQQYVGHSLRDGDRAEVFGTNQILRKKATKWPYHCTIESSMTP